jgi:hypothetical protein
MTNAEIFAQVMSEVTGRPTAECAAVVELVKRQRGPGKWDHEHTPAESARLLATFRAEQAGILNWILAGRI